MDSPVGTYKITKDGFPVIHIYCELDADTNTFYIIKIGSDKKTCMNILIYPTGYIEYEIDKSTIANMGWVEYNKNCAITYDLLQGSGTRHILYAGLQFVRDHFHWIKTIELDDGSFFMCKDPFGKEKPYKVMLRFYNIALHGKSWYEEVAQAYMSNAIENDYIQYRERFNDPTCKIDWSVFHLKYNIKDTDGNIEKAYKNTATYRDFLTELRIHENKYCWYISKWMEPFVNDILGNIPLNKWTIALDTLPIYVMTTTKLPTTGGRKQSKTYNKTRKERKYPPGFNVTEFDLSYKDGFPYN